MLDKYGIKCYNIIKERGKGNLKERKLQSQVRPLPMTSLARSPLVASNKCEPNPAGVKIKGLGRVKPETPMGG